MKKKLVVLTVVVLGLAVVWFGGRWLWGSIVGDKPQFRTQAVMRGNLRIGPTTTGMIKPVDVVDVGAQIVGIVTDFGPDPKRPGKTVDFRSEVEEGDVLAKLDDLPQQAEVEKATANLRLAEAELKRYRARRDQAERDFKRAEKLRNTNSAAEYENAMSQFDIAEAELAMSDARVAQAQAALRQAQINFGYATIRSPVKGTVISRRVNVGQTVVAGLNAPSLFLLAKDLSRMTVLASVNAADIGDVREGQRVTFTADNCRDRAFTGTVSQIRYDATVSQSVVTYWVVVDVDNSDGALLPYMPAKLQFEKARRTDVVLVPNQALRWKPTWEQITPSARAGLKRPVVRSSQQTDDDEKGTDDGSAGEPTVETETPTAWVRAEDGLVRPVPVTVGITDGIATEIVAGDLTTEDEVVIGAVRNAGPDFVSSFVNRVTKKN
jgi:HlyD family secretion protein